MNFEMARLYSRFTPRRPIFGWTIRRRRAEGSQRINREFCDVLRQFGREGVAKRRQWSVGIAAAMVGLLSGCAGIGGLTASTPADVKRDAVASRAKARWDALIKLDVERAYGFLSPASKATMPLDLYKARHKVGMYRAVKVDQVNCEAETCTVNLSVTYDYKQFKGVTTPMVENWIITQGQAWFVERS